MAVETISYSAWKFWMDCPFKHKLIKIDKIRIEKFSPFTCFGKAIHNTTEICLKRERDEIELGGVKDDSFSASECFLERFEAELEIAKKEEPESYEKFDKKLIKEMKIQGKELAPLVLPAMRSYFGDYNFVSAEQEIRHAIDGHPDYEFHGFIDLIIQTKADNKYHIIDWKSCGWGWHPKKKASTEITYQLTFYKHFFCKITGAKLDDVETHFGLMKRTASNDRIELFRVTSGEKKVKNALNILDNSIVNISRGRYVKNKLSCERCEFHRTVHCP